jgi:outer membrane protein insertion porin family
LRQKFFYIFLLFFNAAIFAQSIQQVELKKITFNGNESVPSAELLTKIVSKESPNWFYQFLNKFTSFGDKAFYFDSLLIPLDVASLKSYYQSNGFFKVRIKSSYMIDTSSAEAELNYDISERVQAKFQNYLVEGLSEIPEEYKEALSDYVKVEGAAVYRDAIVAEKTNYIITFLRDHGYMLASYQTPTITIDTMKNYVDVDVRFDTGIRYKINEIRVNSTGNENNSVSDDLLKDIIGIVPGNSYSNYDIQRAQVRLYRTELFNSVLVNSVISDTVGNQVPLNITADVGSLYEVSPEIIANDEESFSLGLGLSFTKKNFLGEARKFTVGTSAAIQNVSEFIKNPTFNKSNIYGYGDLRATIEQPFLFGKTINTRLESYLTGQKLKDEYNSTLIGAKLSLDFELPQFTYFNSLSIFFNIENAKFVFQESYLITLMSKYFQRTGEYTVDEADSLANESVDGTLSSSGTNTSLGLAFGTNKTNNLLFPSEGYTLSIQVEDANSIPYLFSKVFGSEFSRPLFLKTTINATKYFPVYSSDENSFGMKFKVGQILTYRGNKADISLNQRLYAGGSNSVRGWGVRELVPSVELLTMKEVSPEELKALLAQGAATGGFFLLEGSLETRNRIIGKIGSALFVDYGNTWNSMKEFRLDQVAVAVGFGLRYYSDFAPIRIDFGIKAYDPQTKRLTFGNDFWGKLWNNYLQFHIGIGEAF